MHIECEDLATGKVTPARMDRVVRNREAAEVTSDNFWLLVKGSFPWLFWLPAFLLFWLLVLAVLKDTPDMGEANMSAVSLTGELTGERNCDKWAEQSDSKHTKVDHAYKTRALLLLRRAVGDSEYSGEGGK